MRIVHICQRDDPDTGGSLRVGEALAREQHAAGLEVWLLFLYGPLGPVAEGFAGESICLGLESSNQVLRGIPALRRAIRRIEPDVIHSHDGIIWPRLAFLNLGIPLLMHSHLPAWQARNLKGRLGWLLIRRTTDILIGISVHTIDSWIDAGFPRSRIRYVPNGVDLERFSRVDASEKTALRRSLALPEQKKILLWVGRLHQSMKGADRIEHVADLLPDDTVLVVVGNGPAFEGLKKRCSKQMILAGSVCRPEEYYKAADAFLFTSYYEPFGLVILEAVACGLPLLSFPLTQGGGAAPLLEEFDATEIPDGVSADQLCAALEVLSEKMEEGEALRERASTGYSWDVLTRRVVEVYESVLDHSSERQRILHICQRDDLSTGGATRIAFDLVAGQRSCGADSHLLFLYGKPGELGARLPWGSTHYLGLDSGAEVLSKGWRLMQLTRRLKPDVVHHHDMLSWPQLMHLVPHAYCIIYHAHLDYRPSPARKARMAWRLVFRNTDTFITPSRYGRQCLLNAAIEAQRISVVPNGTRRPPDRCEEKPEQNALREKYNLPSERVILGWGGRLHCDTKGTDDFIRLFAHLPETFVGIVAGQGPDEDMLKKLTGEQRLKDRIFFHGLEENMSSFYRDLDGFVVTSHFESFGLVVIEALTHRVPVFSFPVEGGINDLLSLPGVAVSADRSLEAMGRLIQKAFADTSALKQSANDAGREVRQRYSIDRMASETLSLYERLGKKGNLPTKRHKGSQKSPAV